MEKYSELLCFLSFFIIFWKLKKSDNKPILLKIITLFFPFLVVISLYLTSGRYQYESIYLFTYLKEWAAVVLFSISLLIIKFSQKPLLTTFKTLIYSDMIVSLDFYILRYMNLFVPIYSDDVLYPDYKWYDIVVNPALIIPTVAYLAGVYFICLMMAKLITVSSDQKQKAKSMRITTILWMKAFEWEILTFISLFLSIDYLQAIDVFGFFVFMIAVLIMSSDDTSVVLMNELWRKSPNSIESEISSDNVSERQKCSFENLREFYIIETDDSVHVKHREAASMHYKEASLQFFCLKFYGINIAKGTTLF